MKKSWPIKQMIPILVVGLLGIIIAWLSATMVINNRGVISSSHTGLFGRWRVIRAVDFYKSTIYDTAYQAKAGFLTPSLQEGLLLIRASDDNGQPLSYRCRYTIRGQLGFVPIWSISTTSWPIAGSRAAGSKKRQSHQVLSNRELAYDDEYRFKITLGALPSPENWLTFPPNQVNDRQMAVVLRLYKIPKFEFTKVDRANIATITRDKCS